MPESLHNDDLLLKYLDGEMDAKEKMEFEEQLQNDAELKLRLQNLQLAVTSVQQFGTAQRVKAIHKEMMQELRPVQREAKVISMKKALQYTLTVAASILVIIVGINLFSSSGLTSEKLYNQAFVDYTVSGVRGNGTVNTIEKLYQDKDYKGLIKKSASQNLSQGDSLLVGLSYLKTDQLSEAIDWLKAISGQSRVKVDADFYLALAYLKNKNYGEALTRMEQIHSNPNHVYHDRFSDEYINKVKELSSK
jgi:hypothetical protein